MSETFSGTFDSFYRRINAKDKQIPSTEILAQGDLPVVDQGKSQIAGYTNNFAKRFVPPDGGVIVFGDHTRIVKFVDFDFAIGADGTQLIAARGDNDTRFLAFMLSAQEIPNTGYNRHFKFLKEMTFSVPPLSEQQRIAAALSDADGVVMEIERMIAKKSLIKQGAMQDLLTARRRLPGFSKDWELKQVGEIGQFFKGSGVKKDEAKSGENPCVRYGELYTIHNDVVRTFTSHISDEVAQTAQPVRRDDILFAGSGETKEEIGKCAAIVHDGIIYVGGDIIVLRPYDADSIFLSYLLNGTNAKKQKASLGQGDAVVHISATALSSISIRLPCLDEQQAISAVLEAMEAEIQTLGTRLVKARAVKEGMMQNLLVGKVRLT